jgi:hypothetical protein
MSNSRPLTSEDIQARTTQRIARMSAIMWQEGMRDAMDRDEVDYNSMVQLLCASLGQPNTFDLVRRPAAAVGSSASGSKVCLHSTPLLRASAMFANFLRV